MSCGTRRLGGGRAAVPMLPGLLSEGADPLWAARSSLTALLAVDGATLHLEPDGTQWVSAGRGPAELSRHLPANHQP